MLEDLKTSAPVPVWWKPEQESRWDHVKTAFRRDWEQTKSDFSDGRRGEDLNQNLDDTVKQVFGSKPLPVADSPNPMSPHERERHVNRAARQMARAAEKFEANAVKSIEKAQDTLGWQRWNQWDEVEIPLHYGYAAALHYSSVWDNETEVILREEWDTLYPDRHWDEVRETVQQGWSRGRV